MEVSVHSDPFQPEPRRLSQFIRQSEADIVEAWECAVRELPDAANLERPALIDHIPELLEQIADIADELVAGGLPQLPREVADKHALERLEVGFDLEQVGHELAALRDCTVRLWSEQTHSAKPDWAGVRALNQALDKTVAACIQRYVAARDRTIEALDRISLAALETRSLDEFLDRLLRVLVETTPAVDTATILLRDGDQLRVHASVGLGDELAAGFSLPIGEGFAGAIAKTRRPHFVCDAVNDPSVVSPFIRARGVRALYGVPLVHGDDLIGVAHMGSTTAPEFSASDRQLLGAMTTRAILGMAQHLLVTERKRMENDLRERELQFRAVADNIPQMAWMGDATGAMLWYNRRWYEFTGATFDGMQGWGWEQVHHPDHLERVVAKFRHHIATGETWEDTFPLRGADGRYRWFLSRATPIRDEHGRVVRWFGTNTDVTNQRFRTETIAILSSSLDYRNTLEQIAGLAAASLGNWCAVDLVKDEAITRVAIAHVDPAKRELASELARRYPPDVHATVGVPQVIRTRRSECVAEIRDPWLASIARDAEHLALLRELGVGSHVIVPVVARDRCLGTITLVSADPERRYSSPEVEMLEELGRRAGLAIDNARLLEQAQHETRLREEILAVVSHDLKNPLGAVHLAVQMLHDTSEPQTHKYVDMIHRAATRMDHLIGDLLDMASVQAGRLAIERSSEDADALVREAIELHQAIAIDKGINLTGTSTIAREKIWCDRNRVLQVLCNLAGNAMKFCRPGDTVTIQCRRERDRALFTVADTGPGIPDSELPHIFEPYWSAARHVRKGTGLGLYISRGIIEAHGERIWVESTTQGRSGTSFYFTLPLTNNRTV